MIVISEFLMNGCGGVDIQISKVKATRHTIHSNATHPEKGVPDQSPVHFSTFVLELRTLLLK